MTNYPLEPDRQTMEEMRQQALTMGTPGPTQLGRNPAPAEHARMGRDQAFVGPMDDVLYVVSG